MQPTVVASGEEAIALLDTCRASGQRFSLALIDQEMPGMDGFTLLERLRERPVQCDATIMMLIRGAKPGDAPQWGTSLRERRPLCSQPIVRPELLEAIASALGCRSPEIAVTEQVETNLPLDHTTALRILVAEDLPTNQNVLLSLLRKKGCVAEAVGNGREALAALEAQGFDAVLMDVQMPEMDGIEATAAIRAKEKISGIHVPVIAVTAHAMPGDREHCLEAGMDAYLAKPVRSQELFDAIKRRYRAHPGSRSHSGAGTQPQFAQPDRDRD